jgi:Ala-tRNA(Pro) deacylase
MEIIFNKIIGYLNEHGIAHQIIKHAAAGSVEEYQRTMNTRLQQQAKALFVRFKKAQSKGFAIVALPGNRKADLTLICNLLHAREVRLGTSEQLQQVTGCRYGELPPMGKVFGLPLLMDKALLNEERIYFNAGTLTASVILNPKSIVDSEQPILY